MHSLDSSGVISAGMGTNHLTNQTNQSILVFGVTSIRDYERKLAYNRINIGKCFLYLPSIISINSPFLILSISLDFTPYVFLRCLFEKRIFLFIPTRKMKMFVVFFKEKSSFSSQVNCPFAFHESPDYIDGGECFQKELPPLMFARYYSLDLPLKVYLLIMTWSALKLSTICTLIIFGNFR